MNKRNLIPIQRLDFKRRQNAMRRWILIDGIYVIVLGAIAVIFSASQFKHLYPIESSKTQVEFARSTAELVNLRQQLTVLNSNLQSMQYVSGSPDWSILLAALSQRLGDDVALNAVDCTKDSSGQKDSLTNAFPQTFRISGIGRSQQSVARFVLGLEALKFFSRVQLVQTSPQSLRGGEYLGFQLICSLPRGETEQP
jgi:Tfp pilus assembly protein PilN